MKSNKSCDKESKYKTVEYVPVLAMAAYVWRYIDPVVIKLGSRWIWVERFTPLSF